MEKIKKGDMVTIITGKERGKVGVVLKKVKQEHFLVEGINMVTKTKKRNPQTGEEGGFSKVEAPIHKSNLAYYDDKTKKRVKIGIKILPEGGKIRYNKASNEPVDE